LELLAFFEAAALDELLHAHLLEVFLGQQHLEALLEEAEEPLGSIQHTRVVRQQLLLLAHLQQEARLQIFLAVSNQFSLSLLLQLCPVSFAGRIPCLQRIAPILI
jgi:hypothetical protein